MYIVLLVATIWFATITAMSIYGIAKYERVTPIDILVGLIIAPALTFIFAALWIWSSP